ncbi:hypothetical protein MMC20_004074 [Loxospora ochrophaea]|nr:hypothetical protein [Loxospora ochrophaea]
MATFQLLALPRELRDIIYDLALPPQSAHYYWAGEGCWLHREYPNEFYQRSVADLSLLRVSKQIWCEAGTVWFRRTRFGFDNLETLRKLAGWRKHGKNLRLMRNIRLDVAHVYTCGDNNRWDQFFQLPIRSIGMNYGWWCARFQSTFPNLRSLDVDVRKLYDFQGNYTFRIIRRSLCKLRLEKVSISGLPEDEAWLGEEIAKVVTGRVSEVLSPTGEMEGDYNEWGWDEDGFDRYGVDREGYDLWGEDDEWLNRGDDVYSIERSLWDRGFRYVKKHPEYYSPNSTSHFLRKVIKAYAGDDHFEEQALLAVRALYDSEPEWDWECGGGPVPESVYLIEAFLDRGGSYWSGASSKSDLQRVFPREYSEYDDYIRSEKCERYGDDYYELVGLLAVRALYDDKPEWDWDEWEEWGDEVWNRYYGDEALVEEVQENAEGEVNNENWGGDDVAVGEGNRVNQGGRE